MAFDLNNANWYAWQPWSPTWTHRTPHILLRFGHDTSSCRVLTGPQQAHLATRCRVLTRRHGTPRGSLSGPLSQTFQFPDSIPGLSKIPVTASEQITMPESVTREEAATVHRSQMECRYRWEIKGRVPRECRHCVTITTEAPIQWLNSIRSRTLSSIR